LAEVFAGSVTCQVLPPHWPGYRPYCPFTEGNSTPGKWSGADEDTARHLVRSSRTKHAEVVLAGSRAAPPFWRATMRLKGTLEHLGYQVSVRELGTVDDLYAFVGSRKFDVLVTGWGADYPAASQYLVPLAACAPDGGFFNLSGSCYPRLDRRIEKALEGQATEPGRAADAWADIDQDVVDDAAIIPFGAGLNRTFVSRRVGNLRVNQFYGPAVSQLWVH
jgi:peptide/nickel transport system substrate-binding protein